MRLSLGRCLAALLLSAPPFLTAADAVSTGVSGARRLPGGAAPMAMCFGHPDPMKPSRREVVDCSLVTDEPRLRSKLKSAVGTGQFILNFNCPVGGPICQKAQSTFNLAFEILLGNLVLNQNILVNASFTDFCATTSQCTTDGFQVLGGAAPARSIVLEDDDGMLRAYPQALVRQMNLPQHPAFTGSDIFAQFNSKARFHFPEDTGPMGAGQSDFLFVVLHEMAHGLGFTSSWDDYLNDTPLALTPGINGGSSGAQFAFGGFVENIFDRFVIETATNTPLSARTAALNNAFPTSNFASSQAFFAALQASPVFKANSPQVFKLSTTAGSLAFVTNNKARMTLETSLNPYQPGSSVSHADLKTFSDTSDFLMRFRVDPGTSLADAVNRGKGGPLGPLLLGVLESLGYATKANPNPLFKVRQGGWAHASVTPSLLVPAISSLAVLAAATLSGAQ